MANSPQAIKRIRQNQKAAARNKSQRSALRTEIKKLRAMITSADKAAASTQYTVVSKRLDQAAAKNLIHKRNADRNKSRLAVAVNAL